MFDPDQNSVPEPECIPSSGSGSAKANSWGSGCSEVKWDKELEEHAHVQESLQNTQSEHSGSRQVKCEDGESGQWRAPHQKDDTS